MYDHARDGGIPYNSWDALLRINVKAGCRLRLHKGELTVPERFKVIKLADPPPPPKKDDPISILGSGSGTAYVPDGSDIKPIAPGDMADVQRLLFEKEAALKRLKLRDTGSGEVYIDGQRHFKEAALIALVAGHGLAEAQARSLLKEAAEKGQRSEAAEYLIKHAYGFGGPLIPGPDAPAIPPPWLGNEQIGRNTVPSIYSQQETLPVPGLDSYRTDPSIYDPFYQPDQHVMEMAQTASQSGQKEVFDTTVFSGMLKAVRQSSLVDRYLGVLMKALDGLGRLFFMFLWHQEEFEDRYGKQDLPEMEDSLRNNFKSMGDLCLFLKEKSVEGGAGGGLGNASVDVDTPEPDITESARN
jgi:hypothetical protein